MRQSSAHHRRACDKGTLAETVVAIVVLAVTAAMVISFRVTASNLEQRARLRSAAIALIEQHSKVARSIDCVQNAYNAADSTGLMVCGPTPEADDDSQTDINGVKIRKKGKVVKPAGLTSASHPLITIEWADYYHLEDMKNCQSINYPPRSAREITATWRDGTQGDSVKLTRTVLGQSVPRTRGWTAKIISSTAGPDRVKYSYLSGSTAKPVQVPTYKPREWPDGHPYCKVLVTRVGKTRTVGSSECLLGEGWNDPQNLATDCL